MPPGICREPVENGGAIVRDGKLFCCAGYKVVYEILAERRLCDYYSFQESPGRSPTPPDSRRFSYLDDPDLIRRFRDFSDGQDLCGDFSRSPDALQLLHLASRTAPHDRPQHPPLARRLPEDQLRVRYAEGTTSLRRVAELLASLGYEPQMFPDQAESRNEPDARRTLHQNDFHHVPWSARGAMKMHCGTGVALAFGLFVVVTLLLVGFAMTKDVNLVTDHYYEKAFGTRTGLRAGRELRRWRSQSRFPLSRGSSW